MKRFTLVMALTMAAIQAVLLVTTAWDKSDTIDEPHYLATAVRQWNERTLRHNPDAPALPKWGFAVMLHFTDPPLFEGGTSGRHPLWSRPPEHMRRNLFAARSATIALTVVAGLVLAAAALRYGFVAALVTQTLWCFSPTVLANGSLATLDGWVAAWLAIAIGAATGFVDRSTPWRAALVGATLALAAASKVTALGAIPVALVASLWLAFRRGPRPAQRAAIWWIAAGVAFVITLLAVSLLETGPVDLGRLARGASTSAAQPWGWAPFPTWILGLLLQVQHGQSGHLGYLFGQVSGAGWWWFYLAVLLFKTTVGAQLLALVAAVAAFVPFRRERLAADAAILAFPLLLFAVMSAGRTQIGVRYLLPAFPFFFFWLGSAVPRIVERFGKAWLLGTALLLVLAVVEVLSVHPHHLMFFNAWAGGPAGGPRYLITGDDWGQDQRRLGEWQGQERPPTLYYTFYSGDPPHWGITYKEPPCVPTPGHYALQAVEVHRPKRIEPGCLDWLTVEPPDARLGYSIYLYQVTRDRIRRLEDERGRIEPFFASGGKPRSSPDAE